MSEKEKTNDSVIDVIDNAKDYIEARIELARLKAIDKAGVAVGSFIAFMIIFFLSAMVLILGSIAAAFAISEYYGKGSIGFLIVAGFYLLVAIIIYAGRDKLINKPVTDSFIHKILHDESENS